MKIKIQKQKNLIDYYGFTKTEQKKYPVITRILKQLTPGRIEKEIREIQKIKLPPELQKWVKEYEKVGERNELVWKMAFKASEIIEFSTELKKYSVSLQNTKFLISMFNVLLDDIADKIQSKRFLNEILKIPFEKKNIKFNRLNLEEKNYLKFTIKVWQNINKTIQKFPQYKEFKELLEYNIRQLLNGMRYSHLINKKPYFINKTESCLYLSASICSMQILAYFTLDFMCFSKLIIKEFRRLREIVWRAQEMTRNGNWIFTWKEEIEDNDFTSGVFAYAIDFNFFTINDLKIQNTSEIAKTIIHSKIEKKLLKEWNDNYHEINKISKEIKNRGIKKYLFGLKKLLILNFSINNIKIKE